MYKKLLFFAFMAIPFLTSAQFVEGTVTDSSTGESLIGANIFWSGTSMGVVADTNGRFRLEIPQPYPQRLIIRMVGYAADTLIIAAPNTNLAIRLYPSLELNTVQVEGDRGVFSMSAANRLNTESINRGILRKAACCNLSESFETSATVDVVLSDAITGTRRIQMLGLEGIYVQNLFQSVPFSRGLSNVLGFDQIPGPWINSIDLTKGIGAAALGYETMTGQINLAFLDASEGESLHLDAFGSNQSRFEGNAIYALPINEKWSNVLFVNGFIQQMRLDMNDDGFLDMPLREGFNFMDQLRYKGLDLTANLALRYGEEERISGQENYNYGDDFGTLNAYGFGLEMQQYEAIADVEYVPPQLDKTFLRGKASFNRTELQSFFGNTNYIGVENSYRLGIEGEKHIGEFDDHSLTVGIDYFADQFEEALADSAFSRNESVPGIYAQYAYLRPRFDAMIGLRSDFHNLYGTQISPRLHLKYNLKPLTVVRGVAGRGFRAPNMIADQFGYFASARRTNVLETPDAEISWNMGASFLHKFNLWKGKEATWNVDYYFTTFENQWIADRDFDTRQLIFYNLRGNSTAHSVQTDFQSELWAGFGFKASYKYQFVEVDYLSGSLEKPLIPNHRALLNLGYTSPTGRWFLDFTGNYYGSSRLPDTSTNPEQFRLAQRADSYFLFNTQATFVIKDLELYVGSENLANFIQDNAIIDAQNPFGSNFDATMIYAPLNGRTIYAGLRYNLKIKKK